MPKDVEMGVLVTYCNECEIALELAKIKNKKANVVPFVKKTNTKTKKESK